MFSCRVMVRNYLVDSTWDINSRNIKPGNSGLLNDDAGDYAALQAAEIIAESGAKLEIMTSDRSFAHEVMAMNLVPYLQNLQKQGVTFTADYCLKRTDYRFFSESHTD